MKAALKKFIVKIITIDFFWFFIKPIAKFGFFAFHHRNEKAVIISDEELFSPIFVKKEVCHGPFAGMRYPSLVSVGSSLYPKLIGCYERELHRNVDSFLSKQYTTILDIGCAEGYYAIGFAMQLTSAAVYAYDTDETARNLCSEMANLNGVANRVVIRKECTSEELMNFKFTDKSLIICDCEGYEQYLFDENNIGNLKNCDVLIETHDFVNLNISGDLIKLFSKSHMVEVVKSIDDIEKAQTYVYPQTDHLDLYEKLKLYAEHRPVIMDWLIFTPKQIEL